MDINSKGGDYCSDGAGYEVAGFLCFAFLLVGFIACISTAICYLSMPEYYAMQKLLRMLRGGG